MKKEKLMICIFLTLIIGLSITYIYFNNRDYKIKSNINSIKKLVSVDIKGAVANPGVKKIEKGSTVNDLIIESGGLLESADTSTINLSKILEDEMVVIVYTKDEVNEMRSGSTSIKVIEKQCICPVLENDACIDNGFTNIENNTNQIDKVSLNNATKEELMTLSGIGSQKADAIIEYRNNHKFTKIEDLINVKGIGQSTFEKIKDNLTL